jgi:flavin reductase (DIM6/NTAB) family NADH-FMN oxidoreductase RutF
MRHESVATRSFYKLFYQYTYPHCSTRSFSASSPYSTKGTSPVENSPIDISSGQTVLLETIEEIEERRAQHAKVELECRIELLDAKIASLETHQDARPAGSETPSAVSESREVRDALKLKRYQGEVARLRAIVDPPTSPGKKSEKKKGPRNHPPKVHMPMLSKEEPEPPLELADQLRQAMRMLPSSVAVVTTRSAKKGPNGRVFNRGMTVSSFTTLSLDPPMISFNIKERVKAGKSRTLEAIIETRRFLVHSLEANKKGVKIAEWFTSGKGEGDVKKGRSWVEGINFKRQVVRGSKDVQLYLPRLLGEGVKRVLAVEVWDGWPERVEEDEEEKIMLGMAPEKRKHNNNGLLKVGDHVIVVGKVVGVFEDEELKAINERKGLGQTERYGLNYVDGSYVAGAYRKIGNIGERVTGRTIHSTLSIGTAVARTAAGDGDLAVKDDK